jgi:hypothetical protein
MCRMSERPQGHRDMALCSLTCIRPPGPYQAEQRCAQGWAASLRARLPAGAFPRNNRGAWRVRRRWGSPVRAASREDRVEAGHRHHEGQ